MSPVSRPHAVEATVANAEASVAALADPFGFPLESLTGLYWRPPCLDPSKNCLCVT